MSKPTATSTSRARAAEFWKAYFTKFRRHIEDHEVSETAPAPLSADTQADAPQRAQNTRRKRFSPTSLP